MSRATGFVLLLTAALLWSTGGLLIKSIDWTPLAIAGSRSVLAALTLAACRRRFSFRWSVPQVGGAIAYAATVILFVLANKLTTAANAILLQYTAPIYVALFGAWFLGERATRWDWAAIAVALGGITLFFVEDLTLAHFWGNVVALASGVSFAWLPLFLRKDKGASSEEAIFLGNLLAVAVCVPFIRSGPANASGWFYLVLLGVGQLGLSYVAYAKAMKAVSALEAILIPVIEPVLNPIWVLLLLGERPGPLAVVGGILVLGAVAVRTLAPWIRGRRGG
jgi:drug/metabolite transporter (DMT)-like permease